MRDERVLRFRGALAALLVTLGAVFFVQALWPRSDFAPFVMTITSFDSDRVGLSDGRRLAGTSVYRLDYHDRDNWSLVLVSDVVPGWTAVAIPGQGSACRDGAYGHIGVDGRFTVGDRSPDGKCHYAADRWVQPGIATALPWHKVVEGDVVTYESYGERVSFDRRTGLPIRYEAGLSPGAIGRLVVTYEVEQR